MFVSVFTYIMKVFHHIRMVVRGEKILCFIIVFIQMRKYPAKIAKILKIVVPKMPATQDFANFETVFDDFESLTPKIKCKKCYSKASAKPELLDYTAVSRIHSVTLCPMRCLKARLKVL